MKPSENEQIRNDQIWFNKHPDAEVSFWPHFNFEQMMLARDAFSLVYRIGGSILGQILDDVTGERR